MGSFRGAISSLLVLTVLGITGSLSSCHSGSHTQEGKPYDLPNYAPAQAYLNSINDKDEPYRVFGCFAELAVVQYVIIFPGDQKKGLLLIYMGPFIPKVKSIDFDQTSKTWRLRELPNTDYSLRHLPAARLYKYGTNDDMIHAKFDQIMFSHPAFEELKEVKVASLFSLFGKDRSLTAQCP